MAGLQVSLPDPKVFTSQVALPLTVTLPDPAIVASTLPFDAKATFPDPPMEMSALPASSPAISTLPAPPIFTTSCDVSPAPVTDPEPPIVISSLSEDFRDVERATRHHRSTRADIEAQTIGLRVISGIFRCTISGLFIAICMKLEALYVVTSAPDIWSWLFMDMTSMFSNFGSRVDWGNYSMPTHYTSILVTLLVAFTFFYATIRIRLGQPSYVPMAAMTTTVIFLITGYFLIGAFTGFSIILALAILLSTFCLFRPVIATKQAAWEDTGNVS